MINNNLNNYNQKHKSYNINHKQFLTSFGRYVQFAVNSQNSLVTAGRSEVRF